MHNLIPRIAVQTIYVHTGIKSKLIKVEVFNILLTHCHILTFPTSLFMHIVMVAIVMEYNYTYRLIWLLDAPCYYIDYVRACFLRSWYMALSTSTK